MCYIKKLVVCIKKNSLKKILLHFIHRNWVPWFYERPCMFTPFCANSLAPGRSGCCLKWVIFKLISRTDILSISRKIDLRWMPQDLIGDKSISIQVMAWSRRHWSQCWLRTMSPHDVTRPHWFNHITRNYKTWNEVLQIVPAYRLQLCKSTYNDLSMIHVWLRLYNYP